MAGTGARMVGAAGGGGSTGTGRIGVGADGRGCRSGSPALSPAGRVRVLRLRDTSAGQGPLVAFWLGFREGRLGEAAATPPGPSPTEAKIIDARIIEEFAKLQRGLRRLSLAHEQHGEQLQGVAARLQDLDQNVMRLALRGAREVAIDEDTWLRCLDRLDRSLRLPGLPEAARESLRDLHETLCSAAGWRAVANLGAAPEGVHLRIAEALTDPGAASYRIRHILEQGYLRPDGSPVRPAVVVVAGPKQDARPEQERQGRVAPKWERRPGILSSRPTHRTTTRGRSIMKRAAYGIDLGTTNSCIARFTGAGALEVIPIDGQPTVPSVVAFDGREWLCGRRAANHAMLEPHNAVRSIKRHMGEEHYRVRLCGEDISPVQVSAKILAYLKEQAQQAIGDVIREVVITVPAWFNEPQRRATVAAGEMAGLTVTRIINEPTAAALAYRADGVGDAGEERWLVYDLGGGTFDCSILAVSGTCKEVLASCGNTFLGGDDFDHRIVLHLVDGIRDRHGIRSVPRIRSPWRVSGTWPSRPRSGSPPRSRPRIHDHFEIGGRHLDLVTALTRGTFNALIEDYLESTLAKARQALEEARITAANIERVLLVGGSTRIPKVQERVAQVLGIEPEAYVDVDLSVALGAAAEAALDAGLSCSQVVVNIAPHALGVAVLGDEDERSDAAKFSLMVGARGLFDEDGPAEGAMDHHPLTFVPIIRKNARLPARFVEEFYTTIDEQEVIEVAVYQGESRNTRDNVHVGAFFVPLPPMPAGSRSRSVSNMTATGSSESRCPRRAAP